MTLAQFKFLFLCVFTVCFPVLSLAQETPRITVSPLANGFYGAYEVIDDHPNCRADDEVAFRIKSDMRDITFYARDANKDDASNARVSGFPERLTFGVLADAPPAICYRRERRGVNVIRFQVPCSQSARPTEPIGFDPRLDLETEIGFCVSPVGFRGLGGTWRATMTQPQSEQTLQGRFDEGQDAWVDESGVVGRTAIAADDWFMPFRGNVPHDSDLLGELRSRPKIDMDLGCLPFILEGPENTAYNVSLSVDLFVNAAPPKPCEGDDCPLVQGGESYLPGAHYCDH